MSVDWSEFNKFEEVNNEYLPDYGEGNTMATQIATAVNKIIYKYFNDGDVFDNTYYLEGWANDISSYANWLYNNIDGCDTILEKIYNIKSEGEYEDMLYELAEHCLSKDFIEKYAESKKVSSVYDADGPFKFELPEEDSEDEWEEEDEDEFEEDSEDEE